MNPRVALAMMGMLAVAERNNPPAPKCYACDRPTPTTRHGVYTKDHQLQFVGPDCYARVCEAGHEGYQPPLGGPRLFAPNLHAGSASGVLMQEPKP